MNTNKKNMSGFEIILPIFLMCGILILGSIQLGKTSEENFKPVVFTTRHLKVCDDLSSGNTSILKRWDMNTQTCIFVDKGKIKERTIVNRTPIVSEIPLKDFPKYISNYNSYIISTSKENISYKNAVLFYYNSNINPNFKNNKELLDNASFNYIKYDATSKKLIVSIIQDGTNLTKEVLDLSLVES